MTTALIIEDSEDIREGTAEILDLAGYDTIQAKDGRMGIALAIEMQPDIIICDITMRDLDGYEVLLLLRGDERTSSIPIVFMSAKAERCEVLKAMEMGANGYLIKPFDDVELFKAISDRV